MNVGRKPLFVLEQDCQAVTNRIIEEVEKAGMHTLRSFDLDVVRTSSMGFCCPVHGTRACTCHLVILLIMVQDLGTITMVLEGMDEQTSIYLEAGQAGAEEQIEPTLTTALLKALVSKEVSDPINSYSAPGQSTTNPVIIE